MKNFLIKSLKFLGFLLLGVLLLFFAFKGIDLGNLFNEIKEANYLWILLSLCFSALALFSRAHRWNMIIAPLGYKPSYWSTFNAMMTGYLANFAFPRIGEITRCATLAKKENIPADKLLGTVIVERIIDLVTLLILLFMLLILKFDTFGHFLNNSVYVPLKDKVAGVLGFSWIIWVFAAIFLIVTGLLYFLIFRESLNKLKGFNKFKKIVKGILDGLKTVYKMKRRGEFILHSILIWGMYLLMSWVVVFAIPATSGLKLIDGLFLLVIGGLGMSAPVQSGIGAYHWIVSRGIVSVYPEINLEQALAFATISHGSQAIFMILLGSLSFFLLFYRKQIRNIPLDLPSESNSIKSKTA